MSIRVSSNHAAATVCFRETKQAEVVCPTTRLNPNQENKLHQLSWQATQMQPACAAKRITFSFLINNLETLFRPASRDRRIWNFTETTLITLLISGKMRAEGKLPGHANGNLKPWKQTVRVRSTVHFQETTVYVDLQHTFISPQQLCCFHLATIFFQANPCDSLQC